jgi:hypothetical protein
MDPIPGVTVYGVADVTPFTTTCAAPSAREAGTAAVIVVGPHETEVGSTAAPPMVSVPAAVPKPEPEIVMDVDTGPNVGDTLVIVRGMAKARPLLWKPKTLTTTLTLPLAFCGTAATIWVGIQLVMAVAAIPPKVTVLFP